MVGSAIYSILTEDTGVYEIVKDRVYPLLVPAGASMPAIAYFVQDQSLIESKNCHPFFFRASVLLNLWASVDAGQVAYDKLDALEYAVVKALNGYSGLKGSAHIISCRFNMSTDVRDDTFLSFLKTMQFLVEYKRF